MLKFINSIVRDRCPEHVRDFVSMSPESFNSTCATGDC